MLPFAAECLSKGWVMGGAASRTLVVMLAVACALSLGVAVSLFALAPRGEQGEPPVPPVPATSESPTPEDTAEETATEEATATGNPSPSATTSEDRDLDAGSQPPAPEATDTSTGEAVLQPAGSVGPDPFTESTATEDTTSATDFALVAAACVSALGGACSGVAAIMVARRRPPSDE
ncbi:hypothetical protein [Streptomyces tanashiensis]|uniref:Uncharacterized protein n=1 Tax=Streptomyces tanashiensis TaxID=67367 RepID=A0ABY6QWA0_9ACTN|nr:hypothetical protein [Streptomyces tanashiensis]UZX21505.1 hypothetical protein LDH80_12620 [Streptomyces tanashiensis]GGY56400.1 hypothetical protein GCM10010299_73590 [Streptomyces tanashiensis]